MSRHWNPRDFAGGRPPPRRPGRGPVAQFGVTVGLGLALALSYAAGPIAWPFGLGAEPGGPGDVWVIDGDTCDFRGTRIRIADIDTPEVRGECRDETERAARATARMRALLAAGPFELRRTGTRDEDVYGRKLRIVTRDGRSLGQTLVEEGLARRWSGHREPWCT